MPEVGSPQPPAPVATKEPSARPLPVVAVWVRDLLVSLAISAFIIIFLYQPVKVEGTSMMPGLEDQERIFVNKFVYRWEPIQRGDIVVFRYPRDTSKSYIKRVIGVAGDRIRIENGQVFVNGEALDEDYVPNDYADARSLAKSRFRRIASSSSATTAPCRTTAATLAPSTSATSTAKPSSDIGRWRSWEGCGKVSGFSLSLSEKPSSDCRLRRRPDFPET